MTRDSQTDQVLLLIKLWSECVLSPYQLLKSLNPLAPETGLFEELDVEGEEGRLTL